MPEVVRERQVEPEEDFLHDTVRMQVVAVSGMTLAVLHSRVDSHTQHC